MRACRLIVDEPAAGAWNMAVDDVLLSAAAEAGEATLRFYGWAEPTLSLGYFQRYDARHEHAPSRDCTVVRRASGGGAILHDRELTYSLALPYEFWQHHGRLRMYSVVHQSLIESLSSVGVINAKMYEDGQEFAEGREMAAVEPPFLCFDRRSDFDLVLASRNDPRRSVKVAGSAQRRQHRAILQHGSVLLARSECAPSLSGIFETAGVEFSSLQLVDAWRPILADALDVRFSLHVHSAETLAAAQYKMREKFDNDTWLRRR